MKSAWLRIWIWTSAAFLAVSVVFLLATNSLFDEGPASVRVESLYAVATIAALLVASLFLYRVIFRPIESINKQISEIDPQEPYKRVWLDKSSPVIAELVEAINQLSSRVHIETMHANEFSRQVAHELRTPLSILRLKVEQAAERIDPEVADELQSELSRLTQDVEQMLLIARSERGQLTLHRSDCNLDELMADVVSDFRLIAQEEGRDIQVASAPCSVNVDETYMRLIMQNLLTNAVRHGRGSIKMRVRMRAGKCNLIIFNERKVVSADDNHLGLGNRVANALVTAHKNMEARYHEGKSWYAAIVSIDVLQ